MRGAVAALFLAAGLGGCQTNDVGAQTAALTLAPENLAQHQLEMRRFDTTDETRILSVCAGLLQDLGLLIDAISTDPRVWLQRLSSPQRIATR